MCILCFILCFIRHKNMFLDKFITGLRYFGGKSSFDVI